MDISYYYQILDIGISYEKGRQRGKLWRLGERKRLREEVFFWKMILEFITAEENGIDSSDRLFELLERMCKKYNFPNYKRVLQKKSEMVNDKLLFRIKKEEEIKVKLFISRLLSDIDINLHRFRGKEEVYRLLALLHNLPKVMYGKNVLNKDFRPISCRDAFSYARGYMNNKMREEYKEYM